MSGKKKNRNQDKALQAIVLVTAVIQLITAVFQFVKELTG